MRGLIAFIVSLPLLTSLQGQSVRDDILKRARTLYEQTSYAESVTLLRQTPNPTAKVAGLMGQDYFMLGEYKKACEAFEKAFALEPSSAEYAHWLGRSYGRRAEVSNPFSAPSNASKARQYFERAVALDPNNQEALNDLFEFYLQAPGFLGGGYDKAEQIAERISKLNAAEGHFAQAELADRRKQFDTAEEQLRRAIELAPQQVGRVLDLAKYLAKRGRIQESEAALKRAEALAPNDPQVGFARAHIYIDQKRNLDKAKDLLVKYIHSDLTPDDPPREQAERLLKQVGGAS